MRDYILTNYRIKNNPINPQNIFCVCAHITRSDLVSIALTLFTEENNPYPYEASIGGQNALSTVYGPNWKGSLGAGSSLRGQGHD